MMMKRMRLTSQWRSASLGTGINEMRVLLHAFIHVHFEESEKIELQNTVLLFFIYLFVFTIIACTSSFLPQEEEERKRKEEQERQEHEEYLKLKEAFSVDEEGEDDAEADLSVSSFCGVNSLSICCTY